MSRRALRTQRKDVVEAKRHIGFTDEAIKWQIDAVLENLKDERPLPLSNGTQADPRQAWVLPSNELEK